LVFNVLGGREFNLKTKKCCRKLTVSTKGTWSGGAPYTGIDLEESRRKQETVRKSGSEDYMADRLPDYIRFDLKVKLSKERKKTTQIWELDIQNVTNRLTTAGDYYNTFSDKIETYSGMGILPVINYRIEF